MKFKSVIAQVLFGVIVGFGIVVSANPQTQDPTNAQERRQQGFDKSKTLGTELNPTDLKRFDTNGDGKLSEAEKEVMLNAIAIETFTGKALTAEEIREMGRERGFGGDGPGGFGFGGRGGPRQSEAIASRFDADKDGKLNDKERNAARQFIQETRGSSSSRPSGRTSPNTDLQSDLTASRADAPYGNPDLYDEKTLRTLYLRFPNPDWYEELGDFYRTDVDMPADLIVDGVVYPSVGVHFRGTSSYMMVRDSEKKSLNLSIDDGDKKQRLYGYKTLNLLNAHDDASFIREVLYSRICRQYLPAPKANFVKLVINGENWGIYVNIQQFNTDFLQEWFGTKDGVRWKVPPGRESGLVYVGKDPADYQGAYQLQTKGAQNAWADLIRLCETLAQTPDDQLEATLKPIFNIDEALWEIALENVFIDSDGYISRGSDYDLYQDAQGRFHLLSRDNNETFLYAGGGGPNSWESDGPMLSPVAQAHDEMRPVIHRLLAIPHLRARYLAHIRAIVDNWLDWGVLSPIIEEYRSLIDAEVKADDKKLYTYEAFATSPTQDQSGGEGFGPPGGFGRGGGFGPPGGFGGGQRGGGPRPIAPSLKRFVEERREYLLNHSELNKPVPVIQSVSQPSNPMADKAVQVTAEVGGDVNVDSVILYYAAGSLTPFESAPMSAKAGVYVSEIPAFPAGTKVRYYVEGRSTASIGTTAFFPPGTELGALTYQVATPVDKNVFAVLNEPVAAPVATNSPVVINELMANNTQSISDPQGEYDDWIELHNVSDKEVDLSGMYLSDSRKNLRKWAFPANTTIPAGGYLIVWADGDDTDEPGLHANFKLSKKGETVMLVDTDERGNQVLDWVKFGKQKKDTAIGRYPDGTGDFKPLTMTPGKKNEL